MEVDRVKDEYQDMLDEYRTDLEVQGLGEMTIYSYLYCLKLFTSFVKDRGVSFERIRKNDLIQFISFLREEKGYKARTLENYFAAINSFYDFLLFQERISSNIVPSIRRRYLKKFKMEDGAGLRRKTISPKEMSEYLDRIFNPRDKAIATLFVKTGIRRNELISIDIDDINWEENSITLKPKRKRTNHRVFFDNECAKVLRYWLSVRDSLHIVGDSRALFLGQAGQRLKRKGVYDAVTRWAKESGHFNSQSTSNADHFSPHNLRHCFTTYLLESGMQREYVQELRGDARKEAVDIYNHIPKEKLREAYLAAIPQFGL